MNLKIKFSSVLSAFRASVNAQPTCRSLAFSYHAAMLRPCDSHKDQIDELVQSYRQLDILHLFCSLAHAVALLDIACAQNSRGAQKRQAYQTLEQYIVDDMRGWLVSYERLHQNYPAYRLDQRQRARAAHFPSRATSTLSADPFPCHRITRASDNRFVL